MTAYTLNATDSSKSVRFLETISVTDAAASGTVIKAIKIPDRFQFLSLYIYVDAQGGTTPTLDLELDVPDFGSASKMAAPDDGNIAKLADFAGITQVTGVGPYLQTIDIGPGVTGIADDATGAASADARMAVNTVLPPWLVYKFSYDGTTHDEDYTIRLVAAFR